MSEKNKSIIHRIIEDVWNRGDYTLVDDLIARDYVGHLSLMEDETHGPESYKQYFLTLRGSFPDIHYTVEDQIADGDRVVARWSAKATHLGDFQGIPASQNKGTVSGISIFRLANGSVVECWTNYDALGLLQQLGVLPALQ